MSTKLIYDAIKTAAIAKGAGKEISWAEIVEAVKSADIKVKNWLEVRVVVQLSLSSLLTRTSDLKVERYIINWSN